MVRTYKKKQVGGKKNYSKCEQMRNAYNAVVAHAMSVRAAARFYRVDRKSLGNRVSGAIPVDAQGGRRTVLGAEQEKELAECIQDNKLKLWKNGFSIGDGPLRDYNDPVNKLFLDNIEQGEVPQEMVREAHGGKVKLGMEDHRAEDFVKAKVSVQAFGGKGNMLDSDDAPPYISPSPSTAPPAPSTGGNQPASLVQVDASKPTTSVQLRLADGKRIILKLNHSHCVSDIRQHIVSSNPQYANSTFVLMKELTEETQTLEEASLLNAVVVQRF